MPMIYVEGHGNYKTATIKGPVSKKFKEEITEFDLNYLEYENTKCIIKFIENTLKLNIGYGLDDGVQLGPMTPA